MANGISIKPRKNESGKTVYGLRVRRKEQYSSGTFLTKSAAVREGNKLAAQMDDGTFVPKGALSNSITLSQALDMFIEELPEGTDREKRYKSDKISHANIIRKFKFSRLPMGKIEKLHIREFRVSRLKDVSANTVINNMNTISLVFNHANSEWDINVRNPVEGLKKPEKPLPRDRRLEAGEEEVILEEARKRTNQLWLAPLVEFLFLTGMRLGEISNISADQVFLEKRQVYLDTTKTDYPRHVPLPLKAKEVLEKFKPRWGKERVFHVNARSASSGWMDFKKELLNRGLIKKDLHMHDLRHEGISRMFEMTNSRGEPLLTVAHIRLITGHKDINTLVNTYANFSADIVVDAMEAGGY